VEYVGAACPHFFNFWGNKDMLIELHIRRVSRKTGKVGTSVPFPDGTLYVFEPSPELTNGNNEAHVAVVKNSVHIKRLLSIKEFTLFGDEVVEEEETEDEEVQLEVVEEDADEVAEELNEEDQDLEHQMCETVVGMNVTDATAELADLSDNQLNTLSTMERSGAARTTLLSAIVEESESRQT